MNEEPDGGIGERVPGEPSARPPVEDVHADNGEEYSNFVAEPHKLEPEIIASAGGFQHSPDILELIYGLLFDPAKTMVIVSRKPPLGVAFLIVTITTILGLISGYFAASQVFIASLTGAGFGPMPGVFKALLPVGALFGLCWGYLKWFGLSAIIHLAAGLLGGRGNAAGVFTFVGLANMPSIFLIPVNLIIYWLGAGKIIFTLLSGLLGLTTVIWTTILLVIGLKQVHGLTTGRSVLVILSPLLLLAVFLILMIVALVALVASQPARVYAPGFF